MVLIMDKISLTVSILALLISVLTFWLTRLKKGKVKMTQPTIIYFGPDGGGAKHNKVFIRTLLYSTSERGQYIQNMFVKLQRGESSQNFNIWVYDNNGLSRGSGLFIDKRGLACNHHFLLPNAGKKYEFIEGKYLMQVYAETVDKRQTQIFQCHLTVTRSEESEIQAKKGGLYFDWAPNTQTYESHIEARSLTDKERLDLLI